MDSNPPTSPSGASSSRHTSPSREYSSRKSQRQQPPGPEIFCKEHSKEAIIICVEERCSKRVICTKCLPNETDHIKNHEDYALTIQQYFAWVRESLNANFSSIAEITIAPHIDLLTHQNHTPSIASRLDQRLKEVPDQIMDICSIIKKATKYYDFISQPKRAVGSCSSEQLPKSGSIDELYVGNNFEKIKSSLAGAKQFPASELSDIQSKIQQLQISQANKIKQTSHVSYLTSLGLSTLLIDSAEAWSVFSQAQVIVPYTHLVLSVPFLTIPNFDEILIKVQSMKVCALTLSLEGVGLPDVFHPFIPSNCKILTLNLNKCQISQNSLENLSKYFCLLGEEQNQHLLKLQVSLKGNNIDSYLICNFIDSLKGMKNLAHLSLDLSYNCLDSKVVCHLLSTLSSLPSLSVLDLDFSSLGTLGGKDFYDLLQLLARSHVSDLKLGFKNLQILVPQFKICLVILKSMKGLQTLSLILTPDADIECKMKELLGLFQLQKFRTLNLDFGVKIETGEEGDKESALKQACKKMKATCQGLYPLKTMRFE